MNTLTPLIVPFVASLAVSAAAQEWISLFDGKTLNGWQPSENKSTWRVEDGTLVSRGGRSHLFYAGDVHGHNFKNVEFRAEVKTMPISNSGIYLHTHYQETGFPETGYECQVINSYPANPKPDQYVERKMTSSIYAIRNVWKAPAKDNEWFGYHIVVQGKTIRTYINDELMAEYTESQNPFRPKDKKGRLLSSGTFALQGHDAGSVVFFRNIAVKPLPDDLPTPGSQADDPAFDRQIIQLSNDNFPLLDLDVRLTNGLTMDQAMANARKFGYTYGFVFPGRDAFHRVALPSNAYVGLKITLPEDKSALQNLAAGRFDYVIASIQPRAGSAKLTDPEAFINELVTQLENLAATKKVSIWSQATALPENFRVSYDAFWTPDRMDRVIKALKNSNTAMEINDRLRVPSATFVNRAKMAGVRFAFGSDNTGPNDLGKLAYCIALVEQCHLTPNNLWLP